MKILHFSGAEDMLHWYQNNREVLNVIYLIDYELLGQSTNGLDLIESLNIASDAMLVTGRFEEASVLSRCETLGVKMIPESMAGIIPILENGSN
jgi:hypothetical protein